MGPLPRWDRFVSGAVSVRASAGTALYREGEEHHYLHFLQSGLVKACLGEGSAERILGFTRSREMLGPIAMLARMMPTAPLVDRYYGNQRDSVAHVLRVGGADHRAVALSETYAVRIDLRLMMSYMNEHLEWARLGLILLSFHLASRNSRLSDLLMRTPRERYEKMLEDEADLTRVLSQRDLAHHLGITPESLSRISVRIRDDVPPPERRNREPLGAER
jgi:CRP-like cAMP-binding protein